MSQSANKAKIVANDEENVLENELKKEYVVISPNPSSSTVDISVENLKMNNIVISSMDGRVMFNKKVNNVTSYKLHISSYNRGVYMITVTDSHGKIITEKSLKNKPIFIL
ncbi:hypothetical protein J2X31_002402 [Flavobacterium arsenatis]|uniref:Secretion system C-terminal sorting domain-containing protein n=1 Tax=Flavobacterium arsenatis TaxID=1484332 RepID=A0ABU1TQX0_9FLAO|nr:T9SS type A sorting domain-containing protein [Flavobacterium arsenatis]MDR6968379.1 hypothetical protein [Flavobacterium arsenatis]